MKRHQRFCVVCHKRAVYGRDICCAPCLLEKHLNDLRIIYEREHRFHASRRWRIDFYLPERRVGIECEGGHWLAKGHTGGKHFESDIRKYNEATKMGIRIFRFTTNMIQRAEDKAFLKELFGAGGA